MDIIFEDDDTKGERLPKYVLVEFENYKGKNFGNRKIFPVTPIDLNNEANTELRRQVPLSINYAKTVHKV